MGVAQMYGLLAMPPWTFLRVVATQDLWIAHSIRVQARISTDRLSE